MLALEDGDARDALRLVPVAADAEGAGRRVPAIGATVRGLRLGDADLKVVADGPVEEDGLEGFDAGKFLFEVEGRLHGGRGSEAVDGSRSPDDDVVEVESKVESKVETWNG